MNAFRRIIATVAIAVAVSAGASSFTASTHIEATQGTLAGDPWKGGVNPTGDGDPWKGGASPAGDGDPWKGGASPTGDGDPWKTV